MTPVSLLLSDKAKARFDAFSDGVFAIVITLLVLELHIPTGKEHLASTLGEEWPRYLGYFVSFAFIGGIWVAHSTVSHFIRAVDATLMRLNLVLLLCVSLLPFTTGILATHLFASFLPIDSATEPQPGLGSERLAVVLFGVNLTLAALMMFLVIRMSTAPTNWQPTTWSRSSSRVSREDAAPPLSSRRSRQSSASSCRWSPSWSTWDSPSSSSSIRSGSSACDERSGIRKLDELGAERVNGGAL
jgi:uncharacterized membrane protein